LAATGLTEDGKSVPCPVDGIYYLAGPPSRIVFVASTTIARDKLRGKWLGDKNDLGDIAKAATVLHDWRSIDPGLENQFFLATNRWLGGNEKLYREAIHAALRQGLKPEIIEASALLEFLDGKPEGEYVRQQILGIPANRVSLDLLHRLSSLSLDLHWERFGPSWLPVNDLIERDMAEEARGLLADGVGLVGMVGPSDPGNRRWPSSSCANAARPRALRSGSRQSK